MNRYSRAAFSLAFVFLFELSSRGQSYTISTYAGPSLPASGTLAAAQTIGVPNSIVADGSGGFYFLSNTHARVYRVTADGTLTVVAGNGALGFSGDGGTAASAQLWNPAGIALDGTGNLFIADFSNQRIRKVTPAGIISTVAGNGSAGFSGDDGPAISARLNFPAAVAVDSTGNLFIAEQNNNRVRKVAPDGVITTIAGNGNAGFSGDGGLAVSAALNQPQGVAVDGLGNVFIADSNNARVRKLAPAGIITTLAGSLPGFTGDGGPAAAARLNFPAGMAVDGTGNLLIADKNNNRIRKITPAGIISTVAGSSGFGPGGGSGSGQLAYPLAVAVDAAGNMLIADSTNHRIQKVTPAGLVSTAAGINDDGGPASSAQLYRPWDVTLDAAGNVLVADSFNYRIRKVTANGVITTVTGNGVATTTGNGGAAASAQINFPTGIAMDGAGSLFIATGAEIRKVTAAGVISTVGGTGINGSSTRGIAVDQAGNLFIADVANHRVAKLAADGIVSTYAGNGTVGSGGDKGPAVSAQLNFPWGLAVDRAGNLFIADYLDFRIRKVSPDGIISTVAGTGISGAGGDGGPATAALITNPEGLAIDADGNLFIAGGERIRKIDAAGIISTLSGSFFGFSGDGGPAASGRLSDPAGIAVDAAGNVYIAEQSSHRVRKLTPVRQSSVAFTTAAGGGLSRLSSGSTAAPVVAGYASIQPDNGRTTPAGLAIFGFRQNNVLVTEAGVPASPLIRSGRIYAEINGPVNTGLAVANPNSQPAVVSFYFTDRNGDSGQGSTTIAANSQIASFLNEAPFNGRSSFSGTFTFSSSVPVATIALRGRTNERGEFLITTLPVDDMNAAAAAGSVVFPHFADGGGWTSQIVLVNRTDSALTGAVEFRGQSGESVTVTVDGQSSNSFAYSIPPRTSQKLQTSGLGASILSGSVRVIASANAAAPSGLAIFSFRNSGGITVTEAGVPAVPTGTAFRLYAESSGDFSHSAAGSIETGLAVTSASATAATVTVEIQSLDGFFGLVGTVSVPANGQTAVFLHQVPGLASQPIPFQGTLRLSSTSSISVVGLRGRYNERGDFLITTTPPVNEDATPPTSALYIPHLVDAGGYTTQFILFGNQRSQSSSGSLRFFSQSGVALDLTLR